MSGVGKPERETQNRVVARFRDEQTAIAGVLTDLDAELAVLEQRQAKTRALKQGMMQELLTGRTRLVESGKLSVERKA